MYRNSTIRHVVFLLVLLILTGCSVPGAAPAPVPEPEPEPSGTLALPPEETPAADETPDPGFDIPRHTAKNRNFYEIYVGSFYDSDGDGIGDLQGIIEKLDYLNNPGSNRSLGVQGVWLMPVNPSPTYHKYDVTDYYDIDPDYGTMEDFEQLIGEADKRGIAVIIDLVLNHTSAQHPWFLAALDEIENGREPYYQNYYNFSEEQLSGEYYRISEDGPYYEAHFWDQMPDLNMDCPRLREEVADIAKFWLDKGVAGFRLDAVMHIYSSTEQNIEFWTWFADICRDAKEDVFLVGEVWSSEMTIMPYFETGLELFSFPFHGHDGRINKALQSGDGAGLASEIARYGSEIRLRNPDAYGCLFLSNHDTGRSAGFIADINRQKLAAAIYLMVPGNPFIYYGEEIGMRGSGADENKRTAMYWSAAGSTGITKNPAGADNDYVPEQGVVEQLSDPGSLISYYREVLMLKARFPEIFDGTVERVETDNDAVCALRIDGIIIMHNLSGETVDVQVPSRVTSFAGILSPTGDEAGIAGGKLRIPAYATVVLM